MVYEIDINKLHGDIKRYALMAERNSVGSKGKNKLNTQQEINLFKEMIIRNGKQAELLKQLPNFKGISVPEKDEQILNKRIIALMKEDNNGKNQEKLQDAVSEKLKG